MHNLQPLRMVVWTKMPLLVPALSPRTTGWIFKCQDSLLWHPQNGRGEPSSWHPVSSWHCLHFPDVETKAPRGQAICQWQSRMWTGLWLSFHESLSCPPWAQAPSSCVPGNACSSLGGTCHVPTTDLAQPRCFWEDPSEQLGRVFMVSRVSLLLSSRGGGGAAHRHSANPQRPSDGSLHEPL